MQKFLSRLFRSGINNQPFRKIAAIHPDIIFLAEGVLYGLDNDARSFTTQQRIHRFRIRKIRHTTDLSFCPPISERTTLRLLQAERRVAEITAFQRFFGVKYLCENKGKNCYVVPNQINLTHDINFGYFSSDAKYVELLHVSVNAELAGYDTNVVSLAIADFIYDWLLSYRPKVSSSQVHQSGELTSISIENKVTWLTRIFNQYFWYYSGERYR